MNLNNNSLVIESIKNIPELNQAQYSLNQQLNELLIVGNKLGLYDATDFIKKEILILNINGY